MDTLVANQHDCPEMQADFNENGIDSFTFAFSKQRMPSMYYFQVQNGMILKTVKKKKKKF